MWFYSQKTGQLKHNNEVESCGYSGKGECKNDPLSQKIHNKGPIPQGLYQINGPKDTEMHGPYVLELHPSMNNLMFGRNGFLIHGDKVNDPGDASEGCIILNREVRERIISSMDNELTVTE